MKAFEEAIGLTETTDKTAKDKGERISAGASDDVMNQTEESEEAGVKEEKEVVKGKEKIESRLESLARMYEAKRAKKAKQDADTEGKNKVDK